MWIMWSPVEQVAKHAEGHDTNDGFKNENRREKEIEYLQRVLQLLQQQQKQFTDD